MADDFVGYIGDRDFHDATITGVAHEGDAAQVFLTSESGRRIAVAFTGVESVEQHRADEMTIYALTEMRGSPPLRRFVFANRADRVHDGSQARRLPPLGSRAQRACPVFVG